MRSGEIRSRLAQLYPDHRTLLGLIAQGYSPDTIAEATDLPIAHVAHHIADVHVAVQGLFSLSLGLSEAQRLSYYRTYLLPVLQRSFADEMTTIENTRPLRSMLHSGVASTATATDASERPVIRTISDVQLLCDEADAALPAAIRSIPVQPYADIVESNHDRWIALVIRQYGEGLKPVSARLLFSERNKPVIDAKVKALRRDYPSVLPDVRFLGVVRSFVLATEHPVSSGAVR